MVDRTGLLKLGPEGVALSELLEEVTVLKQRDSSAAGVLKLAKDNLDQRQKKIHELSAALEKSQMVFTPNLKPQMVSTLLHYKTYSPYTITKHTAP